LKQRPGVVDHRHTQQESRSVDALGGEFRHYRPSAR
jgi:hypothetical protein